VCRREHRYGEFSGYDYDEDRVVGDGEGPNGDGCREDIVDEQEGGGGDAEVDEMSGFPRRLGEGWTFNGWICTSVAPKSSHRLWLLEADIDINMILLFYVYKYYLI